MQQDNAGLPHEIADWFTEPFARFLKIQAAAGAVLLLAALAALILSNSAWSAPYMAFWETPFGFHFGSLSSGPCQSRPARMAQAETNAVKSRLGHRLPVVAPLPRPAFGLQVSGGL